MQLNDCAMDARQRLYACILKAGSITSRVSGRRIKKELDKHLATISPMLNEDVINDGPHWSRRYFNDASGTFL